MVGATGLDVDVGVAGCGVAEGAAGLGVDVGDARLGAGVEVDVGEPDNAVGATDSATPL